MYFHNPKRISTLLNTCIRFIVPVSLHYQICIFTSLNTCIRFIAHAFFRCQICVFLLSNLCISVTEFVYLFHHTHISVCHYVGVFVYAGAINRTPTAADRLPITWRTPTKLVANTPPGVGADSSCPYPCIIKYVYSRH